MKTPTYLDNKLSVIYFNEHNVNNNSHYEVRNNHLQIQGIDDIYVFIGDYHEHEITFEFMPNSDIQLYMILKSSKPADYTFHFHLHDHVALDVFSDVRNIDNTVVHFTKHYNVKAHSVLRINTALLNRGNTTLKEVVSLDEEFAEVHLDLLNIGSYNDSFVVEQDVLHNAKSTKSTINNSLISNSTSSLKYGVSGRIFKGNEYSSCNQVNKGIILNEFGEIEVVPKLYIDEYNVEASHGAAIGQMDDEQLYYLLSRGLTEMQARSLIISGYTKPFLNHIKDEDIKLMIERQILKKINEVDIV